MTDIITAIIAAISPAALPIVVCVLGCILWCYFIYLRIDRDLHERLLPFDSSLLLDFAPVLPLISSGYFHTARGIIDGLTVENEELDEVRKWLIGALEEADETEDGQ